MLLLIRFVAFVDFVHLMEQMKMCGTFWFVFLFHILLLFSNLVKLNSCLNGGISSKLQAF